MSEYEFMSHSPMMFDPFNQNKEITLYSKTVRYDKSCEKLVDDIIYKIHSMQAERFEPEFIIMNANNYEKLVAYVNHMQGIRGAPDMFQGYKIIVWDVPVNYVNVRGSASTEWLYGDRIKGR